MTAQPIRFAGLVSDKPMGFICHGHSLKELENNIDKFKSKDIFWASLNNYKIAEEILSKGNMLLDLIIAFNPMYNDISCSYAPIYKEAGTPRVRGNSLSEFLFQLKDIGFKKPIFLFGADGYSDEGSSVYYKETNLHSNPDGDRNRLHRLDTDAFNKTWQSEKFGGDFFTRVYNCSPNSHYTPFRKITVKECLDLL